LLIDFFAEEDWPAQHRLFEKELAFGQEFQQAYRDYEAKRLADGAAVDDPRFYDAFDSAHGPIATPPGQEEFVIGVETKLAGYPGAFLCGGAAALFAALGQFLYRKRLDAKFGQSN
jgi:hypothetical protein